MFAAVLFILCAIALGIGMNISATVRANFSPMPTPRPTPVLEAPTPTPNPTIERPVTLADWLTIKHRFFLKECSPEAFLPSTISFRANSALGLSVQTDWGYEFVNYTNNVEGKIEIMHGGSYIPLTLRYLESARRLTAEDPIRKRRCVYEHT
jgi:hypothetical protein